MGKSIDEIEREIAASRARLDSTIDRIQDRLSVAGMVDELIGSSKGAPLASLFDRTLATARRNPVPVLLAAAGLGLLLQRLGADHRERRAKSGADARMPRRNSPMVEEESVPIVPENGARTYDPDLPPPSRMAMPEGRRDEDVRA